MQTPSPERADLQTPSSERADLQTPSPERADLQTPSSERSDLQTPSPERSDLQTPSPKEADLQTPSPKGEGTDLQTPSPEHNDTYEMGEGSDMQAPNAKDEENEESHYIPAFSEPHPETVQNESEQEDDTIPHSDVDITQTEPGKIIETQTVMLKFEETSLPDYQPPTKLPSEPIGEIKPPILDEQDENNTQEFPIQPKLQQKVKHTLVLSPTVEETLPAKPTESFELKFHQESPLDWENDASEPLADWQHDASEPLADWQHDASESCTAERDKEGENGHIMDESDTEEQPMVQQTVTVQIVNKSIVDEQFSSEGGRQ